MEPINGNVVEYNTEYATLNHLPMHREVAGVDDSFAVRVHIDLRHGELARRVYHSVLQQSVSREGGCRTALRDAIEFAGSLGQHHGLQAHRALRGP